MTRENATDTIRVRCSITVPKRIQGATWIRQGLRSRTGHTEVRLPRKHTRKKLNANDNVYAKAA